LSQTHVVNGQVFNVYPCKDAKRCRRFNSALTLQVKVAVKGYPDSVRVVERLNPCMHGGCGAKLS